MTMLLSRWTVRLCLWLLAHTFYRVEVRGAENPPKRGPALLVCNHISFIDPFLIGAAMPRPIRFLMSRPFYETRGVHWLAKLMGAIPVSAADPPREMAQALDAAQVCLRAGELVCLFVDSALMRTGHLPRPGLCLEGISRGVAAPIIPVHLDRVWGNILRFERGRFFFQWPRRIPYRVTVSFGAALAPGASAFQVRQALMTLSAEASSQREAVQRPLP
jgi:acyl-[acyl-carrier-protein]-phospholipid O-acyltransferase/long-chain-fatty-acid--[acyl-carrier-protein] ligase